MFKILVVYLLLINYLNIFSQEKTDRCDVVFGGKNKGFF